jgi:hypothetical protein
MKSGKIKVVVVGGDDGNDVVVVVVVVRIVLFLFEFLVASILVIFQNLLSSFPDISKII